MDTTAIAHRLSEVWPHLVSPVVAPPVLLSAGWESDIYQLDYVAPAADESGPSQRGALVARLYFGRGDAEKAAREFALMARVAAAGYPCPTPLWVDGPDSAWGRPALIMTRAPGNPLWPLIFRSDAATRTWAQAAFVRQLLALHALDVGKYGLDGVLTVPGPDTAVGEQLHTIAQIMDGLPDIGFGDALDWLAKSARAVKPGQVGLAHWDFHPANVLVTDESDFRERQLSVIDWSGTEITDTRFDLAWTLVVIGSQEGWPAADGIRRAYEVDAGAQTDLDFFLAFAYVRRLYVVTLSLVHGAEALGLRPGAETAIRARLDGIRGIYRRWLEASSLPLPALEPILE